MCHAVQDEVVLHLYLSTSTAPSNMSKSCANCNKTAAELDIKLKQCGKCHTQPYCSRECQVAHWPVHKALCSPAPTDTAQTATNHISGASTGVKGTFPFNMEAFLNAIARGSDPQSSEAESPGVQTDDAAMQREGSIFGPDLLDPSHPEATIYKHLIDCFRLRCEDQYTWGGEYYGIYGGESPFGDFAEFLNNAQDKGVLPGWWSKPKRRACLKVAGDRSGDSCIWHAVEKSDIQDMYGDSFMPMRLRSLANQIYGEGVGAFGMW